MRYFLVIEVARSKIGIIMSQRKYIFDLLTETDMLGCKASETLIEVGKRNENEEKPVDINKYQRLVRKLIYLSYARLDVALAFSVVSQHMHSPKEMHLKTVYKILRFLKESPSIGLFFKRRETSDIKTSIDVD